MIGTCECVLVDDEAVLIHYLYQILSDKASLTPIMRF
jgi:hypothetical protein